MKQLAGYGKSSYLTTDRQRLIASERRGTPMPAAAPKKNGRKDCNMRKTTKATSIFKLKEMLQYLESKSCKIRKQLLQHPKSKLKRCNILNQGYRK